MIIVSERHDGRLQLSPVAVIHLPDCQRQPRHLALSRFRLACQDKKALILLNNGSVGLLEREGLKGPADTCLSIGQAPQPLESHR